MSVRSLTGKDNSEIVKKILVFSEIFPPHVGGSGTWFWEIYRRFAKSEVCLLVDKHPAAEAFDNLHDLDIKRIALNSPSWSIMNLAGIRFYSRLLYNLLVMVRRKNVESVHCGRVIPEGVVAFAASKLTLERYQCFIHGEDIELARYSRETRFLVQLVLNSATKLICNSKSSEQLLLNHWSVNPEKIVRLSPGVDTQRFKPYPDVNALKRKFGWEGRRIILTVSRLEKRKGHDKMLEAMPAILSMHPETLYVVVGGGEEQQRLIDQTKNEDIEKSVEIFGECDAENMLQIYQACDLFILPNRQVGTSIEGFGIVLLEAQACGKPVIAGDSGGTSETLLQGRTGLIIDCTNSINISDTVCKLLNEPTKLAEMGRSAREHMVSEFAWERCFEKAREALA